MNAPSHPERPEEPLKVESVFSDPHGTVTLSFNRGLTKEEVEAYEKLSPTPQMYADASHFAERMMLAELIVRLLRFYVMGSIVLPDTPLALDWIKTFIDGNGHGPLGGGPLRWPRTCASACNTLTRWGYEPTKTEPPYVVKTPAS